MYTHLWLYWDKCFSCILYMCKQWTHMWHAVYFTPPISTVDCSYMCDSMCCLKYKHGSACEGKRNKGVWNIEVSDVQSLSLNCVHFFLPHRSPISSPDSLLHCSAVWSGQCDPHSAVAAPTVWWWGSSQLHHHCQSRPQSSHHQWNMWSSHCTLQCYTHCQYCGHQLQWK